MLHQRVAGTSWATQHATRPHDRTATVAKAQKHAVVIGGGIGGLVSAARLAKHGIQVTLLEQGQLLGGRCQSQVVETELGTFRFDTGPSLMLFPQVYKQLLLQTFASLGVAMEEVVPVQRVEPAAYRVWFEGCSQLELLYDVPKMIQQLEGIEPGAGRAYLAWLAQARAALEVGTREFIERDFDSLTDFLDLRRLLPLLGQVDVLELLGQHNARLHRRFKDPRIPALLSFQDLYVGLSPYNAPGVFSLLAATECTDGVFYPMGGFQKVTDALVALATQAGVDIRTGCKVNHISTEEQRQQQGSQGEQASVPSTRVTGVVLEGGQRLEAGMVLSNRDVPLTYQILTDTPHGDRQYKRLSKGQYSAAVIAYNFCLKSRLDKLAHHNVFMSGDYKGSWERATSHDKLLPRPNFYCHCPSRTDPTAAPPGCDSVMVLLPVANIQEMLKARGQQIDQQADRDMYKELVEAGRQAIARTMAADGICDDFLSQVVHEFVIDPVEWKDRHAIHYGAVFGLSHGLDQLALFRPAVKDREVQGLYLAGASARPGNGVPLVMLSADLAVTRVLQDIEAGVV